jgi:hypothetical protein
MSAFAMFFVQSASFLSVPTLAHGRVRHNKRDWDHFELDQLDVLAARTQQPIDVLYLDSLDVEDPRHAEHGLAEIKAAEPKLSPRSIVVFDDTVWDGSWVGIGALGVPYLLARGWNILASGYQAVLCRDPVCP